ncbi:sensor histidine kinase [Aliikangiella coralliicola]|uniref:histidine kinase n=1 Tax=Aliikangiella coralliicola TaxID=2592383 RepID=A0A545U7J1_9GAMM|nr:ATP-binding protein [Aliikangiella coralliicola]TQV85434.1 GHKL domain-containing protein [Aliikangiella coralliicola]
MNLKSKFYLLSIFLHLILLGACYFFLENISYQFIVIEVVILISLILFLRLIKKVFEPFEFVDLFSDVLNEQEFTTRFSHTGNKKLDNLMTLFNQMLSQLYDERLKLGDRKGMLQQLMNAIPLSIIVFDYNNQISQLNPAAEKLLKVQTDEIKSFFLKSIKHPIINDLDKLKTGESQLISDAAGKRYRCHRSSFFDRGFERHFIIIQELTSELKSSERNTYEKLIRMMSHEVNNTMAATGSLLKSCLYYSDQISPDERHDYKSALNLVIERTDNLNSFMQDYAQIVRLPEPSLESCNLFHLALSTKRLFETTLKQKNIALELPDTNPGKTSIDADQNQLEQVFINVIKNAIEAIGENGKIDIQFKFENDNLFLLVKDSGPGISEQHQQNLFTPFFSTKAEGQGIGLMLVREVLDAHQFEFSLYNRESRGACFEIKFPLPLLE